MKRMRKLIIAALSLALVLSFSAFSVFAADGDAPKQTKDADANITYTITLYSGDSGKFSDGSKVKTIGDLKYGQSVKIDINEYKPVVNSDVADKYYPRGFKIAGHDNDEPGKRNYISYTFQVTGDESFTVAYGLKGGLTKYRINYIDDNGNTLHPSEEYYGMPGVNLVVSYLYIEGYAPEVYNQSRYLYADRENNFDFVYSQSNLTAEEQAQQAATTGRRTAAGAANAANGGANAGANNADGTAIGDNATPAAGAPNVVDLDDGNTPQAAPQSDVPKSELSRQKTMGFIIGGVCVAAAVAAAAVAIARRRQYEYEDDDE